jgi:hypothetical protein
MAAASKAGTEAYCPHRDMIVVQYKQSRSMPLMRRCDGRSPGPVGVVVKLHGSFRADSANCPTDSSNQMSIALRSFMHRELKQRINELTLRGTKPGRLPPNVKCRLLWKDVGILSKCSFGEEVHRIHILVET